MMIKTTLTGILLLLLVQTVAGQNRNCATMEVLERQLAENPSLRARFDSLTEASRLASRQSPLGGPEKPHVYPLIPGFSPTGDPELDARSFAAAKKELYAADPELYLRLSSKVTPENQQKTIRQ